MRVTLGYVDAGSATESGHSSKQHRSIDPLERSQRLIRLRIPNSPVVTTKTVRAVDAVAVCKVFAYGYPPYVLHSCEC